MTRRPWAAFSRPPPSAVADDSQGEVKDHEEEDSRNGVAAGILWSRSLACGRYTPPNRETHSNGAPASFRTGETAMRIAISGGTGFVGGHLARRLVELVPFQLNEAKYSAPVSHCTHLQRGLLGLVAKSWNGTSQPEARGETRSQNSSET